MRAEATASAEAVSAPSALMGARRSGTYWLEVVHTPVTWVALIVAVSALVRGAIALRVPAPWILPDEVVYSELAKSIAAGHRPAVRGVPVFGWGEVYPTLIAPAWALMANPVHAYHAALAINALVMSAAAVPGYLLARLFVSPRAALVVALMTVLVPSMAYTGVVMTENVCYPVFLLAVYLFARAVKQPTAVTQTLAALGLLLLAFTRIQGLALAGAYLASLALFALTGRSLERRTYIRRVIPSAALIVGALFAPVVGSVLAGDGPVGWLGARSNTFGGLHPWEVPEWFGYLAGDLVLYVAVAPAAATAVMVTRGLRRAADDRVRLFAAVALPTILAVLSSVSLVSASLDVDGTENLNERYVFYVVPLLFAGLALWIEEQLPGRNRLAGLLLACCLLLAAAIPIDRLHYNSGFQSPGLLPWITAGLTGLGLTAAVAAFTLGCGALWLTCRSERVGRLWLLVGVWMSLAGALTVGSNAVSASDSATHSFRAGQETWIDAAVPSGTRVAVLWDQRRVSNTRPNAVYFRLMVDEFFNPMVGDVYRIGPETYYEHFLPTIAVAVRGDGMVVDRAGNPVNADYVLATCPTSIEGRPMAVQPRHAFQLVATDGSLRLAGRGRCGRSAP